MIAVFHDGLKGYGCCSKRVTTFEEFLELAGCTTGKHSDQVEVVESKPVLATEKPTQKTKDGVEVYGSAERIAAPQPSLSLEFVKPKPASEIVDDEDPEDVVIEVGMECKRNSCNHKYVDPATSRVAEACTYHPGSPVFHEGSKGWSCCTRKVLEFDEFLKITGCRKGRHLFVGTQKPAEIKKKFECRHDFYQSPNAVTISFYAKKVDPAKVKVVFQTQMLELSFDHPDGGRFEFSSALFQPVVAEECKYKVMSTKIEVVLRKSNGISWPTIEPTNQITSWTTFGTTGRVGTIGGRDIVLAEDSPLLKK